MNQQIFVNGIASLLAASIGVGDTTASLTAGTGALLPALANGDFFLLSLSTGPSVAASETVKVTAFSGDTITTMLRQYEGTAQAWPTGTSVQIRSSADFLNRAAAIVSGHGPASIYSVTNLLPATAAVFANYARTKAALARVKAGTGSMKIMVWGDSTKAGYRSNSPTSSDGNRINCRAATMALALRSAGIPAVSDSFFCDQAINGSATGSGTGTLPAYDPRISIVSGGAFVSTSNKSVGGFQLRTSTAGDAWGFLPYNACDTFDCYFMGDTATGTFNFSRTGDTTSGTLSTVNSGGNTVKKLTFTGALGSTAKLVITQVGTAGLFLIGIDAYNSTQPSVRVFNCAWVGGSSADRSDQGTPSTYLNAAAALAPDLIFMTEGGINDGRTGGAGVSVATFTTNVQSMITKMLPTSDIIMETGFPYSVANGTLALQGQYAAANKALAISNNLLINDSFSKNGTWEEQNARGLQSDGLHKNTAGYLPEDRAPAEILLMLQ